MVDHKQKGDGTGGNQPLVVMKEVRGSVYEHVVDANNEPTK